MTGISHGTELIIELLAKGVPQGQVCSILNVAPSTVSEVASTHQELISSTALVASLASYEMDEIRDRLEKQALEQLGKVLPLEMDAVKLARIAVSLNQMSRRSKGETLRPVNHTEVTITNITLPTSFLAQRQAVKDAVVLNAQSEVVALGEQTVAPASRAQIQDMQVALNLPIKLPQLVTVEDI
jgi:predicted XRE-type DNA-binding protein